MSRPIVDDVARASPRWRPFALLGAAVLLLHAWVIDGAWGEAAAPLRASAGPVRVRALDDAPAPLPQVGHDPALQVAAPSRAVLERVPDEAMRPATRATSHGSGSEIPKKRALTSLTSDVGESPPPPADPTPTVLRPDAPADAILVAAPAQDRSVTPTAVSPAATPRATLAEGPTAAPVPDPADPPPTYATRLPPPLVLRYAMRRGFLSAEGELRWAPEGDRYRLALEARAGDALLLSQTSAGSTGPAGLEPERFVDQRLRRAPQAANFDRAAGTIGYSSTDRTHPLVAGTQDRLSLYVQLAGIAAADPARLQPGATLVVAVTGARGDAALWQLRVVGAERMRRADGGLDTVHLVRERRGPADTVADLWLAPALHWMPVRASWRTAQGASEYDLMLDGVSAGP